MYLIDEKDYDYILNKYHKNDGSFDTFQRYIPANAECKEDTGISTDDICEGIIKLDKENEHLPHSLRKAYAFKYVLENTRIAADGRDRFPTIQAMDRPLNKTIIAKWRKEVFEEIIPEVGKRMRYLEDSGTSTIWPDYDHSVPNWERLFALGFRGIIKEVELAKANHPSLTEEEEAFFDSMIITYEAIIGLVKRLEKISESERMKSALYAISEREPQTLYEVLMLNYIYFIICEHIQGLQVRSLSNLDRTLFPYYKSDLARGVSKDEISKDIAYFYLQFAAIANYWGQPVYFGGEYADGTPITNELSYLLLEIYDKMGISNPKLQIKVSDSTPKEYLKYALDMIRRGHNSIVFVSDNTIRRSLKRRGFSDDVARLANVTGCYEYSPQAHIGTGMNYTSLIKPLEYTLFEGRDGINGRLCGLETKCEFESFEEFYEVYQKQLFHLIDTVIETTNSFEGYLSYINPQPMLSATFEECLRNKRDSHNGGVGSSSTSLDVGFLASMADSLTVIKRYCFDRRELTVRELAEILKNDWKGHESLRARIVADPEKYGNNKDLPDFFAKDIMHKIAKYVDDKPNAAILGGRWTCGFHVARMSYIQGKTTCATPDGRRLGEELSKNSSASLGNARSGATAAILSVLKLDATEYVGDCALDLALHPTSVSGDDGLEAMYALLRTFMGGGGHAVHINVFSAEKLRAAQKEPEKYKDLQIRVCGWNTLWNDITPTEQEGFIKQAEALV